MARGKGFGMQRAVLIGYGAIASYVAARLQGDGAIRIGWVIARPGREEAARAAIGPGPLIVASVAEIDGTPDVALEAAGHAGLAEHGPALLARGIDVGVVSIGALADDALAGRLKTAAEQGGARAILLSGAIGGVDALAAALEGGLTRVTYQGRKPPGGWKGSPAEATLDLDGLTAPARHFAGTARQAARAYPKNANVAATVALATLGLDSTAVELWADPAAPGNLHVIEAEGAFGSLRLEIAGRPLPENPKTSALTAMAALRFLRNRAAPVVI